MQPCRAGSRVQCRQLQSTAVHCNVECSRMFGWAKESQRHLGNVQVMGLVQGTCRRHVGPGHVACRRGCCGGVRLRHNAKCRQLPPSWLGPSEGPSAREGRGAGSSSCLLCLGAGLLATSGSPPPLAPAPSRGPMAGTLKLAGAALSRGWAPAIAEHQQGRGGVARYPGGNDGRRGLCTAGSAHGWAALRVHLARKTVLYCGASEHSAQRLELVKAYHGG